MTPATRSRAATRARLLDAASMRFREHGFDGTSVRDIAADAGVDPALIMRYFGSKEGLFTEITLAESSIDDLLSGDRHTLGPRMAKMLLDNPAKPGIETVMRSLGNPSAASRYETELHERFVQPLALYLGGRDALVRAGLIVSILNGLEVSVTLLRQRSLTGTKRASVVRQLGGTLQRLVDNDAPELPERSRTKDSSNARPRPLG